MTVEQLKVIEAAQTEDFRERLEAVNKQLSETAGLMQNIFGDTVETRSDSGAYGRTAFIGEANKPAVGNAAGVPALMSAQTLIGAVTAGASAENASDARPIEIHTTVELDGEKVGESVNFYNSSRQRITNGFF